MRFNRIMPESCPACRIRLGSGWRARLLRPLWSNKMNRPKTTKASRSSQLKRSDRVGQSKPNWTGLTMTGTLKQDRAVRNQRRNNQANRLKRKSDADPPVIISMLILANYSYICNDLAMMLPGLANSKSGSANPQASALLLKQQSLAASNFASIIISWLPS